jgi:hypothetical protein
VEAASIGLFRIKSQASPEALRVGVEDYLAREFPHATFVVDVSETDEESPASRDLTQARNRWRQMKAPSLIYPAVGKSSPGSGVCEKDLVRPATDGRYSESVVFRREFGRERKQRFYRDELMRLGPLNPDFERLLNFTGEFQDLCGESQKWGNLQDKMAVIYFDGNKAGAASARHGSSERSLKEFSSGMRRAQAGILRKLLEERAVRDSDWWNGEGRLIRLETLLWGGDEIIWVAPAWKGWELLQLFFQECPLVDYPLTYSAGLVFCHEKAPIQTIRTLAKDLVDEIKSDEERNRFVYQVLESFDHIQKVGGRYQRLVLAGEAMPRITAALPELRESVSRKKLYRLLKSPPGKGREEIAASILKELRAAGASRGISLIEELGDAAWEHIGELWDYVAPLRGDA